MPMPSYLTIIGKRQKLITEGCSSLASIGNHYQAGREDQILVESYEHNFHTPEGAQSAGRVHGPFTFTKMLDKASPLLFEAWHMGETLSLCTLECYRISPNGFQERFYTEVFKDAVIINIHNSKPQWRDPAFAHVTQLETVTFAYRSITKTHEACGTMSSDYWHGGSLA